MTVDKKPIAVVLGAAGFIGRNTARTLERHGCQVLGIGHGKWHESEWRQWGLSEWLEADITVEALNYITEKRTPQCIIHCGGSGTVSFSYSNPLEDYQRATHSTVSILEWIRKNGNMNCRFVLVSSAAVYGDQGDTNATENSTRSPVSPYGVHKLTAELLCESYSRFFGIPISIVRLFSVYGEGLKKQLLWDALNKFKRGEGIFFGTGNELRDWIHVQDTAKLLTLAGLSKQSTLEIYNGGFEQLSTRDLLNHLAKASGYEKKVTFNGETHTGNPRRLTADRNHTSRLLNWHPEVNTEEGLARYVRWFRSL